jgi:hypothetical protein
MKSLLFIVHRSYVNVMQGHGAGLLNSVTLVSNMLVSEGIKSHVVQVTDTDIIGDIDKSINQYRPDIVIIGALWLHPSKLTDLIQLHPEIKWIIRIHSETPFLAQESITMEWLFEYEKHDNVGIATNGKRVQYELNQILKKPVGYMPNYYSLKKEKV